MLAFVVVLLVAAALRLPRLDTLPNGLIPDEALSAYDAYSILKTGRDQYGEELPLFPRSSARLNSLYRYLSVPSVLALGLTETAARLPAAIAGLMMITATFLLGREIHGSLAGIFAAASLAVSPWHVLLSRTGTDWLLLPALTTVSVLFFLWALKGRISWALVGCAAGLALYSYTPGRVSIPLTFLGAAVIFHDQVRRQWRRALLGAAIISVMAVPVAMGTLSESGQERLQAVRHQTTSVKELMGGAAAGFVASFSPEYYLRVGNASDVYRLRSTGLLHVFEAPLILLGALSLIQARRRTGWLLLWWLIAGTLAVCLHRDCPNPVLSVTILPVPHILAGLGAAWLLQVVGGSTAGRGGLLVIGAFVAISIGRMAHDLYAKYPIYAAPAWGYGVRDMVREIEARRGAYDDVLVYEREKLIYSLILFYTRYEPALRQREVAQLVGRADRACVGAYRVGNLAEAIVRPGRHLVWTVRSQGRELLPGRPPLHVVQWPDGRAHYALYSVGSFTGAGHPSITAHWTPCPVASLPDHEL